MIAQQSYIRRGVFGHGGRLLTRAALLCDCPEQSCDREGAPRTSLETRT